MSETIPFDQGFQRVFLALLLRNENLMATYVGHIEPEFFTYEQYQIIWRIASSYYSEYNELPDAIVFGEEFRKIFDDELERQFYLQEVEVLITLPVESEEYVLNQVDEFLKFRKLKLVLWSATEKLEIGSLEYSDLVNMVRDAMILSRKEDLVSYKDTRRLKVDKPIEYIETGYSKLDMALNGGLGQGMLGVVAAYTGVGKTMWLANISFNALQAGHNVLYVSLEQSVREIAFRIDMIYATTLGYGDDVSAVRNKEMLEKLPGNFWLKDFPAKKLKVDDLSSLLYRLEFANKFKPDLVVVDYAALMRGSVTNSRWEEVGDIIESLRGLAVEHNVAIWTAAQIHREGVRIQHRERVVVDPATLMFYTRDSSVIAETCDRFLVFTTAGGTNYSITLAKTRTGSEGQIIRFSRVHQKLIELSDEV